MPQYTYECQECGHRVKVTAKITDPPLTACRRAMGNTTHRILCNRETGCQPNCEAELCGGELHRVPVATGRPLLKGGGWEKDGYR